jgi:hypothetical protein
MKSNYAFGAELPPAVALDPAMIATRVGHTIAASFGVDNLSNNFFRHLKLVVDTFKDQSRAMKPNYTPDHIRQAHEQGSTSGIPGSLSAEVTKDFMRQTLQGWDDVIDHLLENFENTVCDMVDQCLIDYKATSIYPTAREVLHERVKLWVGASGTSIKFQLECMRFEPYCWYDTWEIALKTRVAGSKDAGTRQTQPRHNNWDGVVECSAMVSLYYDYARQHFPSVIYTNLGYGVTRHLCSNNEISDALLETLTRH